MSIHDLVNKIKGRVGIDSKILLFIMILVLVGLGSFSLGRLSAEDSITGESARDLNIAQSLYPTVSNEYKTNTLNTTNNQSEGKYLASKNGKLYYTVGCTGAKRIKDGNRIWFQTEKEALDSGRTLSTTCK